MGCAARQTNHRRSRYGCRHGDVLGGVMFSVG
jgi:hypothetical protein